MVHACNLSIEPYRLYGFTLLLACRALPRRLPAAKAKPAMKRTVVSDDEDEEDPPKKPAVQASPAAGKSPSAVRSR